MELIESHQLVVGVDTATDDTRELAALLQVFQRDVIARGDVHQGQAKAGILEHSGVIARWWFGQRQGGASRWRPGARRQAVVAGPASRSRGRLRRSYRLARLTAGPIARPPAPS